MLKRKKAMDLGEVIFRLRKALGPEGIEHFRKIREEHGELNACYMEDGIPHPVHFREGMAVRNILRDITDNAWTCHEYDNRWAEITEAAIDDDIAPSYRFRNPITAKDGTEVFVRYKILDAKWFPWFRIYVHNIRRHDADKHQHDHPWSFITILLRGGYEERFYDSSTKKSKWSCLAGFRRMKFNSATAFHQLVQLYGPTWTLVFAGRMFRDWGYWTSTGWIHNKIYRKLKSQNKLPD